MIYTQGISIDGDYYDIPLVKMKRTADVLDKYAKRVESGDLKREVIGTYYNYQLDIGEVEDAELYDRLFDKLAEPVEFHDFELPAKGGVTAFRGYVSSVSDEVKAIRAHGDIEYTSLTCKFISKKPTRVPA